MRTKNGISFVHETVVSFVLPTGINHARLILSILVYKDCRAMKCREIYSSLDPALYSNPIETNVLIVHAFTCQGYGQVMPRPSYERNLVVTSFATSRTEKFCRVEIEA
jgi:hypothetical protein